MSDFVVSARKYRPATFNAVVGQESITTTLKNAIRTRHLAQAFLFCGSRGVGKTTCARILAKTINCTNLTADTEACDQCESCTSFNSSQALNIIELDAASNNSVDDIRSLVEQVRYPPQSGDYKIYIIDEAHMLSQSAFNAFLKTLEEPPPYAIFILATTEKHKIIPTILSRCQIFDFSRIETDDIARHLGWIAEKESIDADPEALHIIALKAEGALRDALSIFDQIVSYSGNTISYKDVIDNLNILDYDYYFRLTDCLLEANVAGALLLFNELLREGFDGHRFLNGFGSHLRDLLVSKDKETLPLLLTAKSIRERYGIQAGRLPQEALYRLLDLAGRCDVEYRASRNPRLHVELALISMCRVFGPDTAPEKKTADLKFAAAPAAAASGLAGAVKQAPQASTATVSKSTAGARQPGIGVSSPPPIKEPAAAGKKPLPAKTANPSAPVFKTPSIRLDRPGKEASVDIQPAAGKAAPAIELDTPVTAEKLTGAWQSYHQQLPDRTRQNLITTLSKRTPALEGEHTITFEVDNKIQLDILRAESQDLLDYLRVQLKNTKLRFKPVLLPPDKRDDQAYTPAEKFKKMAENNPALEKLKKEFDLDI